VVAHNFDPPYGANRKQASPCRRSWTGTCGAIRPPWSPMIRNELHPSCVLWGKWWDLRRRRPDLGHDGWGTHSLDMIQRPWEPITPARECGRETGRRPQPVLMRYGRRASARTDAAARLRRLLGRALPREKGKIDFFFNKVESDPPDLVPAIRKGRLSRAAASR